MNHRDLLEGPLTHSILGAFFEVYNTLGYGFLEHPYVMAMERELLSRGHRVARELCVPITYKGHVLCTQRMDMVVDDKVVVETKSTAILPPSAPRQLFNYLKATHVEVGLLLHFGPDPVFHRLICRNKAAHPSDPPHPPHPFEPSS